jgi:hypothetical protein
VCSLQAQTFSIDDLLTLSSLPPKRFDEYMKEKGFMSAGRTMLNDAMALTFMGKNQFTEDSILHSRTVNLYKQNNTYCFAFHTTSVKEFTQGKEHLKKLNFFYGDSVDFNSEASLLFQQKNITVETSSAIEEGSTVYSFLLKKRELPVVTRFADDLLKFDSHELLISYFGEENVKRDIYYFSEKEIKKCSVLFGNSTRQVVFVWEDQDNLCKLSYILISGIMPTENGLPFNDNIGRNKWAFKCGIYSGMSIRELLDLNERDFNFYGEDSEFSMMIEPKNTGRINFQNVGIMLSSLDGTGSPILKKQKISAEEAVDNRLALHISYIVLTP